jgi:two-component system sensor histidine kinase DesK
VRALGVVAAGAATVSGPLWTPRRSPWFLLVPIVPFVAAGPVMSIPRHDLSGAQAATLVLVAVAVGALQFRHSLALAQGRRPVGGGWTLLALLALVYPPLLWVSWDWSVMQWFAVASAAMVLRGRFAVAALAPIVVTTAYAAWLVATDPGTGLALVLVVAGYQFSLLTMGGAALYGSARLVRVLDELSTARTELAELAVERERLRVARDLHDLLGQSLSAVSLKGDLALRLLPTDAAAARAEIEGLTGVARGALRDVRAVARDEHGVSLPSEVEAATALLAAAGIATRVDVDLPDLSGLARPAAEVLAWAVREGATNVLRHSEATAWSLTGRRLGGRVTLEMVNDGAAPDDDWRAGDATGPAALGGAALGGAALGGAAHGGAAHGGAALGGAALGGAALGGAALGGAALGAAIGDGAAGDGVGRSGLAGLRSRAAAVAGSVSAGFLADGRFRLAVEIPDGAR